MHHPTAAHVHAVMAVSPTRSCQVGADRRSQYFLHDRKLSALAHYLRSRTRNLYKSSDYLFGWRICQSGPLGTSRQATRAMTDFLTGPSGLQGNFRTE
jgi:hypothetical protein